jgi:hypothetical protein
VIDSVNGVSFHPTLPYIAASTGQRHFSLGNDNLETISDSEDEHDSEGPRQVQTTHNISFHKLQYTTNTMNPSLLKLG